MTSAIRTSSEKLPARIFAMILAMGFDSPDADAEFTRNDLVLLPLEQPCQHLVFPRGQFCEPVLDYSRFGMARMFVVAANQSLANGTEQSVPVARLFDNITRPLSHR